MSDRTVLLSELWRRGRRGDRSAWIVLFTRIVVASVWFIFGAVMKIGGVTPRHREIVARILGTENASLITVLIGIAEMTVAFWFVSGFLPRTCAFTQTVALVAMNTLELIFARNLILAPMLMVVGNALLLSFVWYAALWTPHRREL